MRKILLVNPSLNEQFVPVVVELRVRFFGKTQIRILVSKSGFCVSSLKFENGFLIRSIHSSSGFIRSDLNPDF